MRKRNLQSTGSMRLVLAAVSILMFFCNLPSTTMAQSLSISASPSSVYLPWSLEGGITEPLEINVSHSGAETEYFLTVSRGDNYSFDPRYLDNGLWAWWWRAYLPYMVMTPEGGIAKDLSTSLQGNNVISGSFDASSQQQSAAHTFTVFLRDETFQRYDDYSDRLEVTLYEGSYHNPGSAVARDRRAVTISTIVPQLYEIRLVSPGAPPGSYGGGYDLFLDDLEDGATGSVDILYRTNMLFSLEASSQNGGRLVSDGGERIPYTMRTSGRYRSFNLRKTERLIHFGFPTGVEFRRETLTVEVEASDVRGQPPGYYTDVVTFDIIAK